MTISGFSPARKPVRNVSGSVGEPFQTSTGPSSLGRLQIAGDQSGVHRAADQVARVRSRRRAARSRRRSPARSARPSRRASVRDGCRAARRRSSPPAVRRARNGAAAPAPSACSMASSTRRRALRAGQRSARRQRRRRCMQLAHAWALRRSRSARRRSASCPRRRPRPRRARRRGRCTSTLTGAPTFWSSVMTAPRPSFISLATGIDVAPSTTCTVTGIERIASRLGTASAPSSTSSSGSCPWFQPISAVRWDYAFM